MLALVQVVVLFVGRMAPQKQPTVLVHSLVQLARQYTALQRGSETPPLPLPPLHAFVVGDGPLQLWVRTRRATAAHCVTTLTRTCVCVRRWSARLPQPRRSLLCRRTRSSRLADGSSTKCER